MKQDYSRKSIVGLTLPSPPPTVVSEKLVKKLQNTLGIKKKQKQKGKQANTTQLKAHYNRENECIL